MRLPTRLNVARHDVPDNVTITDLHDRLRLRIGFLTYAGPETTGENYSLHFPPLCAIGCATLLIITEFRRLENLGSARQ